MKQATIQTFDVGYIKNNQVNETILYAKNYKYIAFSQLLSHV
jgi:hypothetical protein